MDVVIHSPVLYRAFGAGRIGGFRKRGRILLDAISFDAWLQNLIARRQLFARYRAAQVGSGHKQASVTEN